MSQTVERFDPSRRGFLRGAAGFGRPVQRPPWALEEALFVEACTRCDDCVKACDERILVRGSGGYPEVDFGRGACTFCGGCLAACDAGALAGNPATQDRPWNLEVSVEGRCLSMRGITCRSCGDACGEGALRFRLEVGGIARPTLDQGICTGCGACYAACPVKSISMAPAG